MRSQSAGTGGGGGRCTCIAPSVLVDAEYTDSVELRELGDEDCEEGHGVDHKVYPVVLGVEAGEDVQDNGGDGEELARGGELDAVVHLLPVCEEAGLALVRGLERRPLHRVQKEVHAQVVEEVGECPDHRNAGEGDTEQDDVQQANPEDVGQPDTPAVHHPRVGVDLAVRRAHVHDVGLAAELSGSAPVRRIERRQFSPYPYQFPKSMLSSCYIIDSTRLRDYSSHSFKYLPFEHLDVLVLLF